MPFDLKYYANGEAGGSGSEPNAGTMAQHAVEAVNRDTTTGNLGGYDNNGDGYMVRGNGVTERGRNFDTPVCTCWSLKPPFGLGYYHV
jgi:hypothetical protein